jgi:hypothetical protein
MRALCVVIRTPFRDLSARVEQIPEPAHVQALIAEPAIEAFDVGILHGLAGLNVHRVDLSFDAPGQEVPRGKFRAVVAP